MSSMVLFWYLHSSFWANITHYSGVYIIGLEQIFSTHSLQRGTESHLKGKFPPEMTSLKSQQNFQTHLKLNFRFTPIKRFQDDWSQNNNRQTFTDRHLLIPIN